MLHIPFIRENKEFVLKGLAKRNFPAEIIEELLQLDNERKKVQTEYENSLANANKLSKEIGALYSKGERKKAEELKKNTGKLKDVSKKLDEQVSRLTEKVSEYLYQVPNIPHSSVPAGINEDDNEEIFSEGSFPKLYDKALPHWELAQKYKLIDFELGTKVTGAGFPVYTGKGAKLQRALITYFLEKNSEAGYLEIQPPLLINESSGFGTGQLPDKEGQMYHITKDNLYLIPTSEVPLTNLYRNMLLKESELPILNTAYTPCFRREAGSYGAHVRGLNRLHQFDKVEIVQIEHPEKSYKTLDTMVEHIKDLLRELHLPFRILRLCGGDLGFTAALTYDFEIYSAGQKQWLEVSSVSNFETYQSNRLKLRFKDVTGKNHLAHTLNGSALALPRIMAGILENYQTPKGIEIPEVLVKHTGFQRIE